MVHGNTKFNMELILKQKLKIAICLDFIKNSIKVSTEFEGKWSCKKTLDNNIVVVCCCSWTATRICAVMHDF